LHASFWLVGPPASGKSRVIETLTQLMGNAHTALDLSALHTNSYQLANVPGKRVVTCAETPTNSILTDHLYKQLVSGDRMVARQIRREPIEFTPVCKIWWAMNVTPRNLDHSGAVNRRVLILPFNRQLEEYQIDRRFQEKLSAELSGIFNWALAGLRRLEHQGHFTVPQQVSQANSRYQSENDTENAFIEDWCVRTSEGAIRASDLYAAYRQWCRLNGHEPKTSARVAADWLRLGLGKKRGSPGVTYVGVVLTDEARQMVEAGGR
jgi:putative DNA primase/helicase